jgi:hypothetical protein
MSNATAQAVHAVGRGVSDQRRICTLSSHDADLHVSFAPEFGMVACSMSHAGEQLLAQRSGLAAYARSGSTMGIPLLYPPPVGEPAARLLLPLRRTDGGDQRRHSAR